MLAIMMMIYIGIRVRLRPELAPPLKERVSWRSRLAVTARIWPAIILVVAVLGAIYTGVATPTEAAAVGAVGALLLALGLYKKLDRRSFLKILRQSVTNTGMLMWILGGAVVYGYALTLAYVPQNLVTLVAGMNLTHWQLLLMLFIILFIAGMFLEGATMILLTTPILLPIIESAGWDPIWYGIILVLSLEMAVITPPVGLIIYIVKGVCPPDITVAQILRGALPFVVVDAICMAVFMIFPGLALWLPSMMMGAP
jgi:tripartite ATP-independent transporter DctM subunit